MKKLVPVVCLLALGCGDDDRPADSGTIVLMDTGARDAGGGGVDAGGGGVDAGGGGMDAGSGSMCADPLPDLIEINAGPGMGMLLPRCSADTATAISMCTDTACLDAALMADTTPGVDIGGGTILDCSLCYNVQFNKCADNACPTQFADLRCCAEANGCTSLGSCPACSTQLDMLNACVQSSLGPGTCDSLLAGCFPSP